MKRAGILAAIGMLVVLAGCAPVLTEIADWTPFAVSTFDGFVAIVSPGNATLPAEAGAIAKLVTTLGTDATAAEQAGSGLAGTQKVIAEIASIDGDISTFEAQLSAAGATIPANDQKYVAASAAFVLATLEGYEAVLQSKAPAGAATASEISNLRFQKVSTPDGCAGFTPASGDPRLDLTSYKPAHFYADCGEAADGIDVILTADGQVKSVSGTKSAAPKPPTLANWKRQFNAIAKKYGHPEKQLRLSTKDHLVHVLTVGKR